MYRILSGRDIPTRNSKFDLTLAPVAPNISAIALPIPRAPPVTMHTGASTAKQSDTLNSREFQLQASLKRGWQPPAA